MTLNPRPPCPTPPPRFGHGANPAVSIPAAVPDDQCSPVTGIREAAPVPGPPVRMRTGAAQTSPQAVNPGVASGTRERLAGGELRDCAAGEPPAIDPSRAVPVSGPAARDGSTPDNWGVFVDEVKILAMGGEGAHWWAMYQLRQPQERMTCLEMCLAGGHWHVACDSEADARWLAEHMASQGVHPKAVWAARLSEREAAAQRRREKAGERAAPMEPVRAETARQNAAQRRGRGKPKAAGYKPGANRRMPPGQAGGAA